MEKANMSTPFSIPKDALNFEEQPDDPMVLINGAPSLLRASAESGMNVHSPPVKARPVATVRAALPTDHGPVSFADDPR